GGPGGALPQPHRHADDVESLLDQQRRRERAVDAAAHGDDDTRARHLCASRAACAATSPGTRTTVVAGGPPAVPARAVLTEAARICSRTRWVAATLRSISARVVGGPRLKRTPPRAASVLQPSASRTCDGSPEPAAHAEPTDTATPSRSSAATSASPGTAAKPTCNVLARQSPLGL